MDARGSAVAARSTGLLVKLAEIEVEVVEHDVSDVGEVNAFTESRRCDHDAQPSLAKEALDFEALGIGHLGVVEHDLVAELVAQSARNRRDLSSRVAVDDALLARAAAEDLRQIRVLIAGFTGVDDVQIFAHRRVDHPRIDS